MQSNDFIHDAVKIFFEKQILQVCMQICRVFRVKLSIPENIQSTSHDKHHDMCEMVFISYRVKEATMSTLLVNAPY